MHDLVDSSRNRRRRHGSTSPHARTWPWTTGASPPWARSTGCGRPAHDRRRRRTRHAGLGRHPHPLRRPGHMGRGPGPELLARGDHHRHRQLRGRLRPGPPRPPRLAHRADGGRGGHPRHRPGRRHDVGLGELPRVSRRPRTVAASPSTSAPRSPTVRCGPTSWANAAPATRPPTPTTSRRCAPSSGRPSPPARSASRRRGPSPTAPSTASPSPGPTRPRTSSSASAPPWASWAPASSSWRPTGVAGEDVIAPVKEVDWMRRLSVAIGRPVTFALLQIADAPDLWRELMAESLRAAEEGAQLWPQVAARATGLLTGLHTSYCLFDSIPAYQALKARNLDRRAAPRRPCRDPYVRDAIVSFRARARSPRGAGAGLRGQLRARHAAGLRAGPGERSLAAIAAAAGRHPLEVAYEVMLEADGHGFCTSRSSTTRR